MPTITDPGGSPLLLGTSNKPGSSSVVLINGDGPQGYTLQDADFGNVAWEMIWSGIRGTQGARIAGTVPQNRPLVMDIRVTGSSADDLQQKLSRLWGLYDEFRRYGGTVTWRPKGATYRSHFDVLAGQASIQEYDRQTFQQLNMAVVRCEAICAPYIEGDPFDVTEDFSSNRLNEYVVDGGSLPNVAVAGGVLTAVANLSTETRLIHTTYGYVYGDQQGSVTMVPGATITSLKAGVILKRIDALNYLEVYVDDNGTNSRLRIDKVVAGARTNLQTGNLGARMVNGQPQTVRGRIEGDVVYAEDKARAYMTPMEVPDAFGEYVLSAAERALFGRDVTGKVGFSWTPQHASCVLDNFEIRPYVYHGRYMKLPEEMRLNGPVPGDAPALADLWVTHSSGSRTRYWAACGWIPTPPVWNLCWNGDFEIDADGWTNAAVTNFINASTSIVRSTTPGVPSKFGLAWLTVTSISGNATSGANFPFYRRVRRGVTYTASCWVMSTTSTAQVDLRLGNPADEAVSSAVALSTTWQQLTVSYTPTADYDIMYVGVTRVTSGAADVFQVDGVMVYEGTVAPTVATQIEGRGAPPPFGIIEAESMDVSDGGVWAITAAAALRGGQCLSVTTSGSGTASAGWYVDPSLMLRDDFTMGEVSVEVYAALNQDADVNQPTLTLSARPEAGLFFGAERFTEEFGNAGRVLIDPAGTAENRVLTRLGTLRLTADRSAPTRWKLYLSATWAAGSAGVFQVDYLLLLPSASRCLSPTGQPAAGYPTFITSNSETTRVIRSDLSGLTAKPPGAFHPDHGLGGSLIEFLPGNNTAIVKINGIPDSADLPDYEETAATATVHFAFTPRWHLARS